MPIKDRNLKPGDKLVARYRKQSYTCEVVEGEGGKLHYRLQDGKEFKSPSAAGMAITSKSCNGWAFWSLETPVTPPSTVTAPTEANAGVNTTKKDPEPSPESKTVKKTFARTPNQRGVPKGQTRWYCPDCKQSFVTAGKETQETCPKGHSAN